MMKRRKFALALGTASTAAVGAIGTGAFSAAQIEGREMNIPVSCDAEALIGLIPNPDVAGVHNNNGELSIDLTGDNRGLNESSTYQFGYFVEDVSTSDVDLGEFPFTQSEPSARSGDEFGSAFLIANQTDNEQTVEIEYELDTDPADINTQFWFEAHNNGKRQEDIIKEPTDKPQTATGTLDPGETIGVSALFYVPDEAREEEITGKLAVRVGEAAK